MNKFEGFSKCAPPALLTAALSSCEGHRAALDANQPAKVIYPKYSKHLPYTVAHTIDCVCSKMLNHGLNHGLFLSLFKLIPCPIH